MHVRETHGVGGKDPSKIICDEIFDRPLLLGLASLTSPRCEFLLGSDEG